MSAIPVGVFTDGSGSVTTGGTAQDALGANGGRQYVFVQNLDDTDGLWVAFGATAVADQCFYLAPGAALEFGAGHTKVVPTGRVSVLGATTGNKFVVKAA